MQEKWIDFHCHILPEIDDGSRSIGETLRMLFREAAQGVGVVIATPHFYASQDQPEVFLRRRDGAENALRRVWGPELPRIGMGAEVAYFTGMKACEALNELCIRGTNLLLVEMPFCHWSREILQEMIFLQNQRGFQIVLAHVERYLSFRNEAALEQLRAAGIYFQVNAGAFLHRKTRGQAFGLLQQEKIQFLGSDCHNMSVRPPNFEPAIQYIEKECGIDTVRQFRKNSERLLYGAVESQRRKV